MGFVIIILAGSLVFKNEIQTLLTLRKLENSKAYKLNYTGSYALDAYLEEGAESWDDVLDFLNQHLGKGVGKYIYKETGCSSFFARTPEGDYLLARNLDMIEAIPCVIQTQSVEGYASYGVTDLMRGGFDENESVTKLTAISSPYYTLDGMNEHGLAIASASVPYGKDQKLFEDEKAIHDITVNRVILDKAKDVEEAIGVLEQYFVVMESKYPSHYMIGDATGKCVVIEFKDGEMIILEMVDDYMISTNFVINSTRGEPSNVCERYARYDESLSHLAKGITEIKAMDLLKENVIKGQSQWSVVYNLTKKTMTISFAVEPAIFQFLF